VAQQSDQQCYETANHTTNHITSTSTNGKA